MQRLNGDYLLSWWKHAALELYRLETVLVDDVVRLSHHALRAKGGPKLTVLSVRLAKVSSPVEQVCGVLYLNSEPSPP